MPLAIAFDSALAVFPRSIAAVPLCLALCFMRCGFCNHLLGSLDPFRRANCGLLLRLCCVFGLLARKLFFLLKQLCRLGLLLGFAGNSRFISFRALCQSLWISRCGFETFKPALFGFRRTLDAPIKAVPIGILHISFWLTSMWFKGSANFTPYGKVIVGAFFWQAERIANKLT